jgi:hypothetical protein
MFKFVVQCDGSICVSDRRWSSSQYPQQQVVGNVACCTTLDGEITMEAVATAVKNKWTEALTGVDATSLVMYASTDHGLNISLASDAMWNPKQHGGSSVDHPIIAYVPAEIKVTSKGKSFSGVDPCWSCSFVPF